MLRLFFSFVAYFCPLTAENGAGPWKVLKTSVKFCAEDVYKDVERESKFPICCETWPMKTWARGWQISRFWVVTFFSCSNCSTLTLFFLFFFLHLFLMITFFDSFFFLSSLPLLCWSLSHHWFFYCQPPGDKKKRKDSWRQAFLSGFSHFTLSWKARNKSLFSETVNNSL